MAAYTDSTGFDKGSAARSNKGLHKVYLQEVTMDFANIATERAAAGLTALTASDTIQIMDVPANTAVLGVWGNVLTVEGKTYTHHVGTVGGDPDGFIASLNANALGVGAASLIGALLDAENHHLFTSADTIDLTIGASGSGTCVTGKILFSALCVDVSGGDS